MRGFQHENVLELIGVTLVDRMPAILLPLMQNGDLRSYLRDADNQISEKDLIGFAIQIAQGIRTCVQVEFVCEF